MSPPEPMLSTPTHRWPAGGDWILQPKWDGFRLLIEVAKDGRARAWSRNGASLTQRIGGLCTVFEDAPAGSVFDGELVAVSGRQQRSTQDFAMVCRAVLRGDQTAAQALRFVAFDVLELAGENLRGLRWSERDGLLAEALPQSSLVRRIESLPATEAAHAGIVALGFEGSVLKRRGSIYRAGRGRAWLKHKARYTTEAVLLDVRRDRDGQWHAICDLGARRMAAVAGPGAMDRVGEAVTVVYSRVDADGGLREARLAAP